MSHENPKTAALFREHRSSSNTAGTSTYTYRGPVGIIGNQTLFQNIIPNPHDTYKLQTGPTGKPTQIDRQSIHHHLTTVMDIIQFRVFCHGYRMAYVGSNLDTQNSEDMIISQCSKNLKKISMTYYDTTTRTKKTSTPDIIYKQMSTHIALLPEAATCWAFCLP